MEQKEPVIDKKTDLFIGIDLGTSSSAIVSSNGKKNWCESYVGWPKDFISEKVIGKSVLFGTEALKHRLSMDVYRPLESGVIKEGTDMEAESVKELIRHLIGLAKPAKGQDVYAVVGVPAEAFKVNKVAIMKAVSGYVHSLMVVSEPFAVAYGMNLLDNALVIDIGAGTVDFCVMHGTIPTEDDQKTILTAGDYIDQQLFNLISEKYPNSTFNLNMVRIFKEQNSFVGNSVDPVKVEIPVEGKPRIHDITDEMKRSCESILPPLVETLTEMIAKVDPEYQKKIRGNIVLAGCGSQIRGIPGYIKNALKDYGACQVTTVEDPLFAGANGAVALAQEMPKKYWKKIAV
ncbi:MAG: rod shape-determining protein [Candidatus Aminicenantes bacterium]|nr:rod shape-determining protein [Candidatus Aminicenantes bacterium]